MSEIDEEIERYAALNAARRESNQARHARALAFLVCSGLTYEAKNGGAHLIVTVGSRAFDYWPGTGKYHLRGKLKSEYKSGGIIPFLNACGFNFAQINEIGIRAESIVHTSETPVEPIARLVDTSMTPIPWRAHMSAFAVSVYRDAGFVVTGAP